ncbi:MFS transporter [Deinococcus sp.]|uniref:MFS transporter n=1 Tax=Deinococcus sp. TaxID=47478 RepID=UPI003CC5E5EE
MTAPAPDAAGFRTFLKLWASQGVSLIGSVVSWFALSVYLAQTLYPLASQRAELALGLSLLGVSQLLPAFLIAPLAGVWADRHDRRLTMLVCDLLSGAVTLLSATLMWLHVYPLWGILCVSVAISVLDSFQSASLDTSYSLLVPREQLPRASGMMQSSFNLSQLLAPSLAALFIALQGGVALTLLLDALSFWVAAAVLWRLKIPRPEAVKAAAGRPLRADLAFGWVYILRRPPLLILLLTLAAVNFCWAPFQVFQPLLLKGQLAADLRGHGLSFEAGLALLTTLTAAAGLGGGLLVSAWGGLKRQRIYGVLLLLPVGALCLIAIGLSKLLFVTALAAALMFLTGPVMNAHSAAIWQGQVSPELQGRVFSVRRLIAQTSRPLSIALVGPLAARFPVGGILICFGAALLLIVLAQLLNPALRRIEDREYLESLAASRGG